MESNLRRDEGTLNAWWHPDNYLFFDVDRKTAESFKNTHSYIRTPGGKYRVFTSAKGARKVTFNKRKGSLTFEYGNRRVEAFPKLSGPDQFKKADEYFTRKGGVKKGTHIGFRIGEHGEFTTTVNSRQAMMHYINKLEREWAERAAHPDEKFRRDNPISQLEIIHITGDKHKNAKAPAKPKGPNRGGRKGKKKRAKHF